MSHHNLSVLSVVLLLAGCGGGDFSTAGLETGGVGPEGTGGGVEADAGAAGAIQGTGGVTGVTGGQAAVTGGSAGTGGMAGGGTGGQQAGSGGDPGATGGAATGGQQAATGGASGGSGGACNPPRLMPEDLPQTIVWESYLGTSPNYMGSYDVCVTCQQSPCTTCSLAWWPIDQSADGTTVTAKFTTSGCAPVAVNMGACTSDLSASSCTTWDTNGFYGTFTFQLLPKSDGTGYRAVHRVTGSWGGISQPQGGCSFDSRAYSEALNSNQPAGALLISVRDTVAAAELPCGS